MNIVVFGLSLVVTCSVFAQSEMTGGDLEAPPEISVQVTNLVNIQPFSHAVVDHNALILAAARKHKVPAAFVKSIMAAESNFDPLALSPKGAIGLMQLMPSTAQLLGADPMIPEQNVDAGAHYLRILMDRYRKHRNWMKRVIAAYNAGPGVVDHYHGVPPYHETRAYVARVMGLFKRFQNDRA